MKVSFLEQFSNDCLVSFAAVFWDVTQRSSERRGSVALIVITPIATTFSKSRASFKPMRSKTKSKPAL